MYRFITKNVVELYIIILTGPSATCRAGQLGSSSTIVATNLEKPAGKTRVKHVLYSFSTSRVRMAAHDYSKRYRVLNNSRIEMVIVARRRRPALAARTRAALAARTRAG